MDENLSFTPVNFFQIGIKCHALPKHAPLPYGLDLQNYQNFLLPDLSSLTGEKHFADVAMGWRKEGVELFVYVKQPYLRASYPQYEKGDSFEVCIDTRDVKTSGYNTKFCHHFFFLPEAVEGLRAGELTKFRTEDAHPLCNALDLSVQSTFKAHFYLLQCFIPADCLLGYDPEQYDRLGMTYRVNRAHGSSQHFSVRAEDYKFQEQPSLWASVRLIP